MNTEESRNGAVKKSVIANQRARWRGNPHPLTRLDDENAKRRTDCHTSDIGHWFAMTTFVVVRYNSPNSPLARFGPPRRDSFVSEILRASIDIERSVCYTDSV